MIMFLPTASPDLNLQEHVWKAVRKQVSHNHLDVILPESDDRFLNKLNSTTFNSSFLDTKGYSAIGPLFRMIRVYVPLTKLILVS